MESGVELMSNKIEQAERELQVALSIASRIEGAQAKTVVSKIMTAQRLLTEASNRA
jgi:hypothetical protein